MSTDRLFRSAHDALTFAFRFAHQASPRTPMSTMFQSAGIGSGKGLVGIDGAAQAGLILGSMRYMPVEQRNVLTVRYGDIPIECPCCGGEGRTQVWLEAVDELSHSIDCIHDLHRRDRRALVVKAVCRRGTSVVREVAINYGVTERAIKYRYRAAKDELAKLENRAVASVEAWLRDEQMPAQAYVDDGSDYAGQVARREILRAERENAQSA